MTSNSEQVLQVFRCATFDIFYIWVMFCKFFYFTRLIVLRDYGTVAPLARGVTEVGIRAFFSEMFSFRVFKLGNCYTLWL